MVFKLVFVLNHVRPSWREANVCKTFGRKRLVNSNFTTWTSMQSKHKYSDEQVKEAVAKARSFADAVRILTNSTSGSSYVHLKKRIIKLKCDISHFDPKWNLSEACKKSVLKNKLRCNICKLTDWLNKPITLQVDHKDGNYLNNLQDNLQFLCPNCHSQTENFGFNGKNQKAGVNFKNDLCE